MKTLLIILLLPVTAASQYVDPVISKDYLERIKDSSQAKGFLVDTTNNVKNAFLIISRYYNGNAIKKISVRNGHLKIQPAVSKTIYLSGNFNSTISIKRINRLPTLQKEFVQGRSMNGSLTWQGPETGELFSYGPGINTLEFDGSNYPYDVNGKLVPAGSGNGRKAMPYDNNIFRTAVLLSQSLALQGKYVSGSNQYLAKIKMGQSRENTFIKYNKNNAQNFSTALEAGIRQFNFSATYSNTGERFSNSNRNGFLNRVYQNAILTPVSFDNSQGTLIGNPQRSYSTAADNPLFLLEDNDHSFFQSHKIGSLAIERKYGKGRFKITQSTERLRESSNEGYKPGTVFFPGGVTVNRKKTDANYFLNAGGSYDVSYDNYYFHSTLSVNYIFGNTRSVIDYGVGSYRYNRSSHDFSLNYFTEYDSYDLDAGIRVENKFYSSNSCLQNDFFLPGVSGFARLHNVFGADGLEMKLVSTFNNFNSELPVSTSFSQNSLTRYSSEQALQYLPIMEVDGFNDLLPVRHNEWTARAELNYKNRILFQTEIFNRTITDDIFPVYENGAFTLKNIASHRNRGTELELTYNSNTKTISNNHSLSFFSSRDIVTDVREGYNFTAIAGFSNINRAIVKGEALGAIVGNKFLRNGENIVIGNDGFPLAGSNLSVIGDPTLDFIIKGTHSLSWKKFSFNLDWEWKKGGDVWNGTQAVLDYYGRSENSALLRNTTNYVFAGVFNDGHANHIPVSFYDPNSLFERNRWVRYGHTGVAEEYIQRGDHIRINNVGLSYRLTARKYIQSIAFTLSANNLILWTAYKGADPNQLLYDQSNSTGLDFFNLPSLKNFGFNISIQF